MRHFWVDRLGRNHCYKDVRYFACQSVSGYNEEWTKLGRPYSLPVTKWLPSKSQSGAIILSTPHPPKTFRSSGWAWKPRGGRTRPQRTEKDGYMSDSAGRREDKNRKQETDQEGPHVCEDSNETNGLFPARVSRRKQANVQLYSDWQMTADEVKSMNGWVDR